MLRQVGLPVLGRVAGPCTASVTPHQPSMITAMIVVAIMIFSALSLDSWMPSRFWRKK